jgi:hypothetical protein
VGFDDWGYDVEELIDRRDAVVAHICWKGSGVNRPALLADLG